MISLRKTPKTVKLVGSLAMAIGLFILTPTISSAHCDSMEGPTVTDGLHAMDSNNINYALKWVAPEYEQELKDRFDLSMKVRGLGVEAKEVSEQYFLSELVRFHRAGEGAPFDGLKPVGTPIDEVVIAADESMAMGNLAPLMGFIEAERMPELEERFERAMAAKDFDVNDVEAGREYIEAYVEFFHFAEGEEAHEHNVDEAHENHAALAHGDLQDDAHEIHATGEQAIQHSDQGRHGVHMYTVRYGDTLAKIANRFGVSYHRIAQVNNIKDPNLIYSGQALVIEEE